jgi:hypothetical protein
MENNKILKKSILFVLAALLFNCWLIWDSKENLIFDYNFISKEKSKVLASVYSVKKLEVEEEKTKSDFTKTIQHNAFEYYYKFNFKQNQFTGKDYSFIELQNKTAVNNTPFNVEVEFINEDPKKNRIKEFSLINNNLDFFKEYFMFNLFIMLFVIVATVGYYHKEQKKHQIK